jgi:hypothetical protein
MVAAGTAKVVEVVLAGKVEHRSPAPDSLVSLDPCDLVADETVTALPGFAEAQRVRSPGRHRCLWRTPGRADNRMTISVTFAVEPPPESLDYSSLGASAEPIAGRPSVTIPLGTGCNVETGHIPFTEAAGATDIVETVAVSTDVPPDLRDSADCAGAVAVATALWPRLPSA